MGLEALPKHDRARDPIDNLWSIPRSGNPTRLSQHSIHAVTNTEADAQYITLTFSDVRPPPKSPVLNSIPRSRVYLLPRSDGGCGYGSWFDVGLER